MAQKKKTQKGRLSTVRSNDLLADLVIEYLAVDGSYGLYDARTLISVREKLVAEVGMEKITVAKAKILKGIVG